MLDQREVMRERCDRKGLSWAKSILPTFPASNENLPYIIEWIEEKESEAARSIEEKQMRLADSQHHSSRGLGNSGAGVGKDFWHIGPRSDVRGVRFIPGASGCHCGVFQTGVIHGASPATARSTNAARWSTPAEQTP